MFTPAFYDKFFSITDFVSLFGWFFIISILVHIYHSKNKDKEEFTYFISHYYWKMFMSMAFGLTYLMLYGGGDTTAYFDAAIKLNKLFYHSPSAYFTELFSSHDPEYLPSYYLHPDVGRPPMWIFREKNSWFVAKITSVFTFFCLESYLTINLIFGFLSSVVTWHFFRFINRINPAHTKIIAFAILFIPTTSFWCSSLMKDTVVYIGLLLGTIGLFRVLDSTTRYSRKTLYYLLIALFLILPTRSFVLLAMAAAFSFAFLVQPVKKNKLFALLAKGTGFFVAIAGILLYFQTSAELGELSADNLIEHAEMIQQDFANNETYSGNRYDLGEIDYTPIGLLKVAPLAISATLFRPFIWEVSNPILLINSLENLIILFTAINFVFKLFNRNQELKIHNKSIFYYALVITLILGFFFGLTSGLYGVLVRMKAPVLIFFGLLVTSYSISKKQNESSSEID